MRKDHAKGDDVGDTGVAARASGEASQKCKGLGAYSSRCVEGEGREGDHGCLGGKARGILPHLHRLRFGSGRASALDRGSEVTLHVCRANSGVVTQALVRGAVGVALFIVNVSWAVIAAGDQTRDLSRRRYPGEEEYLVAEH